MKQVSLTTFALSTTSIKSRYSTYFAVLVMGILGPLGFAPFHMPGFTILSLSFLYFILLDSNIKQGFLVGFIFGLGYFGLGVSWVIISIHDYGQLNFFLAGIVTLLFLIYLALFPAIVAYLFKKLATNQRALVKAVLFSTLWSLSEIARSTLLTGFPWLLIGTTQIDTPLRYLAPVFGIYGLSLLCTFAAAILAVALSQRNLKRYIYLSLFVLLIIVPALFKDIQWAKIKKEPISVGVIQGNLAMRDKWDDTLFQNLLTFYEQEINKLLGKNLIILPESAIPLPSSYLEDYLLNLHSKALKAKSAIMLGILKPVNHAETSYYNSIISLGIATGEHLKNQLVPFGEYIPQPFVAISRWLNLPQPNIISGKLNHNLIKASKHLVASLICYELAYPNLLRLQLPQARFIVSISDNGWFGRSLASYQQLQMAQFLSLLTGRYQIVVNNDGLSSIIDYKGQLVDGLPPFSSGILQGVIYPAEGTTPWVIWYDYPVLIFCSFFLFCILYLRIRSISKK